MFFCPWFKLNANYEIEIHDILWLKHEWLVLSFELSQRQNLTHVASNKIFTTENQQTTKKNKKRDECSVSRYEIQIATLNAGCEHVM